MKNSHTPSFTSPARRRSLSGRSSTARRSSRRSSSRYSPNARDCFCSLDVTRTNVAPYAGRWTLCTAHSSFHRHHLILASHHLRPHLILSHVHHLPASFHRRRPLHRSVRCRHTYPYSSSPSPRATLIISTIHLGYTTTRIPTLALIIPTSAPRPPPGLRTIRIILDLGYTLPILFSARHTCVGVSKNVTLCTCIALLSPTHFSYLFLSLHRHRRSFPPSSSSIIALSLFSTLFHSAVLVGTFFTHAWSCFTLGQRIISLGFLLTLSWGFVG